jgi:hypothetical protein
MLGSVLAHGTYRWFSRTPLSGSTPGRIGET